MTPAVWGAVVQYIRNSSLLCLLNFLIREDLYSRETADLAADLSADLSADLFFVQHWAN